LGGGKRRGNFQREKFPKAAPEKLNQTNEGLSARSPQETTNPEEPEKKKAQKKVTPHKNTKEPRQPRKKQKKGNPATNDNQQIQKAP